MGIADGIGTRLELIGKREVRRLRTGKTLWDSDVRGFGVVAEGKRKTYFLETGLGGRHQRFVIGTDGAPWSPESARREAWRIKSRLMIEASLKASGLTRQSVERLKPGQVVWDHEVKGLGLRCQRRAKVYVLKTRLGGRQRWFTIGEDGSDWSPESARVEAKRLLREIAQGRDPGLDRAMRKGTLTVDQLCDLYLAAHAGETTEDALARDRRLLADLVRPLLGRRRLRTLSGPTIERCLRPLMAAGEGGEGTEATRTQDGRDAAIARRAFAILAAMFDLAIERGLMRGNPLAGSRLPAPATSDVGAAALGLLRLGREPGKSQKVANSPAALAAIRLVALTGCDSESVVTLRWSQVDLQAARLHLDDGDAIPLGIPALAMLRALPRSSGSDRLFPGLNGNLEALWQEMRRSSGGPDLTLDELPRALAGLA